MKTVSGETSKVRIEVLPLGALFVLHNPASAALVLATEADRHLIRDDAAPDTDQHTDQHMVQHTDQQQTLAAWTAAGLFEDRLWHPQSCLALQDSDPLVTVGYDGPGGRVLVDLPDGELLDQLDCLLSPCFADPDTPMPQGGIQDRITIAGIEETDTYTAYSGTTPVTEIMSLDEARYFVAGEVSEAVMGPGRTSAAFHAAAVAKDGRALILMAESGGGKTTTALGLINAGCQPMSDDHLPLTPSGRSVLSFPTAIGLKPGTVPLPEAQALLARSPEAPDVRDGVRYVMPPEPVAIGTEVEVAAIVFPRFSAGSDLSLETVPPHTALIDAIASGARVSQRYGSAAPLVSLLNSVPSYRMAYSRSDQSIPACLDLLAQ